MAGLVLVLALVSGAGGATAAAAGQDTPSTSTTLAPLIGTGQVNPSVVRPFQLVTINGDGYAPNTALSVAFSNPAIPMDDITSRPDGTYHAQVRIPLVAPPGDNAIVVSGAAPEGRTRSTRAAVMVRDMECADFPTAEGPNFMLDADPSDPHGLDPDRDGLACEELPATLATQANQANALATSGVMTVPLIALGLVMVVYGISCVVASRTLYNDEWPVF